MSGNALSLFQAEELELMVRGSVELLDVQQMQLSTRYENGFERDHLSIKLFWSYFEHLEPSRQRKLLAFITGALFCALPPLTLPDPMRASFRIRSSTRYRSTVSAEI